MPISIKNHQKVVKIDLNRLRRSLKRVMAQLHCDERMVVLSFVDDNEIKKLNNEYLKRNRPTNVLSFAMGEGEFGNINPQILGDIVISVETASRDALISHVDLVDELEFLIIHGILHLLGYNHENTSIERATTMHGLERDIFFHLRGYGLD
jgi:probable rRNA maturation factor